MIHLIKINPSNIPFAFLKPQARRISSCRTVGVIVDSAKYKMKRQISPDANTGGARDQSQHRIFQGANTPAVQPQQTHVDPEVAAEQQSIYEQATAKSAAPRGQIVLACAGSIPISPTAALNAVGDQPSNGTCAIAASSRASNIGSGFWVRMAVSLMGLVSTLDKLKQSCYPANSCNFANLT